MLNAAYKILAIHLKNQLKTEVEHQNGFRQGRSLVGQIFALQETLILGIWDKKVLRKIYSGKKESGWGGWKRKKDRALQAVLINQMLWKWSKGQILRWRSHIERMGEKNIKKEIVEC